LRNSSLMDLRSFGRALPWSRNVVPRRLAPTKYRRRATQSTRHTMQSGTMVLTQMNRMIFGQPAAATIVAVAERLGAKRVLLL